MSIEYTVVNSLELGGYVIYEKRQGLAMARVTDEVYDTSEEAKDKIRNRIASVKQPLLDYGMAITEAKAGSKIARKGWSRKNMLVVYMPPLFLTADKVNDRTRKHIGVGMPLDCQAYFASFTDNKWQPGWLASQEDTLAVDWYIVHHK